ncbi:hypothetical protein [uncultured Brevundimonas sp.]|uniref:hypothetical protein n=1 Tax=uncultured Brevundimonas sp. TaxID=213418 RepID=UPI0025E665A9|nr:hypothetical protein [uncultured Brevundimonas sp.]
MSKFVLGAMLLILPAAACDAQSWCGKNAISDEHATQIGVRRGFAELQHLYPGEAMTLTAVEAAWKRAAFLDGPDRWRVIATARRGDFEYVSFVDVAACGGEVVDYGTMRDTI